MNIYITLDYELFLGKSSGSVQKCILEPSEKLFRMALLYEARFTWFVDVGYLIALEKYAAQYPSLQKDYEHITTQLQRFIKEGHDIQLHIHPHWEYSSFDGEEWTHSSEYYKLSDFTKEAAESIIIRYKAFLEKLTNKPAIVYRAGGWCLQPFSHVRDAFKKSGIVLDCTVYKHGVNTTPPYHYDFSNCPEKEYWLFEDDLCKEDAQGSFIELPISNITYSPLFFWKLFVKGRLNPNKHKPIGDGQPVDIKGMLRKYLRSFSILPVSIDGYFCSRLKFALKKHKQKKHMVVIGHPKACTKYSLTSLEKFLKENYSKHNFITLSEFLIIK